jgi:hypothetical protein
MLNENIVDKMVSLLTWQFNSSLVDNYWNIPLLVTPLPDLDLASSKMSLQMVCISALGVFVFLPDFPFFTDV